MAAFIPILLPVVVLLNIGALVIYAMRKSTLVLLPALVLLTSFRFFPSTLSLIPPAKPAHSSEKEIKLLSYNVSYFQMQRLYSDAYYDPKQNETVGQMREWLLSQDADILCLQEFFDDSYSKLYNTVERLSESGYECYFMHSVNTVNKANRGLAIFSRYPIVNRGELFLSDNNYNGAAFADVVVAEGDTLRVINMHLESMRIKVHTKGMGLPHAMKEALRRYKWGAEERANQTEAITDFIHKSPYPVLLAGDLNDTPYSYVYRQFRNQLENTFEEAGSGFGFTYRGNRLFFLRIDHIFNSPSLQAASFNTHQDVWFSDHFPLTASFRMPVSAQPEAVVRR